MVCMIFIGLCLITSLTTSSEAVLIFTDTLFCPLIFLSTVFHKSADYFDLITFLWTCVIFVLKLLDYCSHVSAAIFVLIIFLWLTVPYENTDYFALISFLWPIFPNIYGNCSHESANILSSMFLTHCCLMKMRTILLL